MKNKTSCLPIIIIQPKWSLSPAVLLVTHIMDMAVAFLLYQTRQPRTISHLSFFYLSQLYHLKKGWKKQLSKYIDTEYGLTIEPSLSSINNDQKNIEILEKAILRIRQDIIDTAKKVFAGEIKKHCTYWFDNDFDVSNHAIVQHGNICNIFDHLSEKYDDNWEMFMHVTLSIYLSPVVLHKSWISELKNQIETIPHCHCENRCLWHS